MSINEQMFKLVGVGTFFALFGTAVVVPAGIYTIAFFLGGF